MFGARSFAFLALDGGGHADLRVLAGIGFLKTELHVVAEIAATVLPPAAVSATAHELAKEVVEHVGKGGGKIEAGRPPATVLESRMAEAVIGRALVAVFEDVVSLVDLLELMLGRLVAGIAVGMVLLGELAVRAFDVLDRGLTRNAKDFVIAALAHRQKSEVRSRKSELRR